MPIVQDTQAALYFKHARMGNALRMAEMPSRFVPPALMQKEGSAEDWLRFALDAAMPVGKAIFMRTAALHHAARCWLSDERQPVAVEDGIRRALQSRNPQICRPMLDGLHEALHPNGIELAVPRPLYDHGEAARIRSLCTILQMRCRDAEPALKKQADEVRAALAGMVRKHETSPQPLRPAPRLGRQGQLDFSQC